MKRTMPQAGFHKSRCALLNRFQMTKENVGLLAGYKEWLWFAHDAAYRIPCPQKSPVLLPLHPVTPHIRHLLHRQRRSRRLLQFFANRANNPCGFGREGAGAGERWQGAGVR